ncbi:MAG: DUF6504 family protein [Clostridia bacterium]
MAHLLQRGIRVSVGEDGSPRVLFWEGRRFEVAEIGEVWKDVGRWWSGEREKIFYRLKIVGDGVWEIYRVVGMPGSWTLYKIYD